MFEWLSSYKEFSGFGHGREAETACYPKTKIVAPPTKLAGYFHGLVD
jgi:hypothetical protein